MDRMPVTFTLTDWQAARMNQEDPAAWLGYFRYKQGMTSERFETRAVAILRGSEMIRNTWGYAGFVEDGHPVCDDNPIVVGVGDNWVDLMPSTGRDSFP